MIKGKQSHHLIHANVAFPRAPLDDPLMEDFVRMADEIDALAEATPGFVAMPTPADEGQIYKGDALLNLTIWETIESLDQFTHEGPHGQALKRRLEWFEQRDTPNYVLYWAPVGHLPTEAEVQERLDHLSENGPSPYAFSFDHRFTIEESIHTKFGNV